MNAVEHAEYRQEYETLKAFSILAKKVGDRIQALESQTVSWENKLVSAERDVRQKRDQIEQLDRDIARREILAKSGLDQIQADMDRQRDELISR